MSEALAANRGGRADMRASRDIEKLARAAPVRTSAACVMCTAQLKCDEI